MRKYEKTTISLNPLGRLRARIRTELAEKSFGVLMIDLLEYRIGKCQAADLEPPLSGRSPIIKVLVGGLEKAKVITVHFFRHPIVRAEHHAILILHKQVTSAARLAPEFRLTRTKLHHHVRMLVEHGLHPVEIFRPSHVQRNKSRFGMFCEHAITCFQQGLEIRIIPPVETPVRMTEQFLVPLIGRIDRMKERLRVTTVNEGWNTETPALFPDGIK